MKKEAEKVLYGLEEGVPVRVPLDEYNQAIEVGWLKRYLEERGVYLLPRRLLDAEVELPPEKPADAAFVATDGRKGTYVTLCRED